MTIQRDTNLENVPLIDRLFKVGEPPLDRCSVFIAKRINPVMITTGIVVFIMSINAILLSIFMLAGLF